MKEMKEPVSNYIELDKTKIDESIADNGEFESEGIFIKKWTLEKEENGDEGEEKESELNTDNKYICLIQKDDCQFSGTLNEKFLREGYGIEVFRNGDKYFGQFESDQRNENGIYFFAPAKNNDNDNVQSECYLGNWRYNKKDRYGIYLWTDEPENNNDFENVNFDAYVGEFEEGMYIRGTFLSKIKDDYYLYHGNFDKEGKKNDNDAYFYSSKANKIFHGKVIKDALVSGYFGTFDQDGDEAVDVVYCKFNEDGSVEEVIEQQNLNEDDLEEEKNKINIFRNTILDGDYFGKLYSKYSKIKMKIENLGDMTSVLEREANINAVKKILNKYTKKNIYFYIEENFFGREL